MEGPKLAVGDEGHSEPTKLSKEQKTAQERALLIEKVANADYDTLTARGLGSKPFGIQTRDGTASA